MNDERVRLLHGPAPGQRPGRSGLVTVRVHAPSGVADVLARAREVLTHVLDPTQGASGESPEARVPSWFAQACAPEPTATERERWLAWWRTLDHAGKVAAERERGWTLQEWLSWMEPEERTWWWWDAQPTSEFDGTIAVEVEGSPTALGALEWLLTAAGASTISEPQHG